MLCFGLGLDESSNAHHLSCYDFISHTHTTQTRVLCLHTTTQLPPSFNSSIQSLGLCWDMGTTNSSVLVL